jgi:hypothetical protein
MSHPTDSEAWEALDHFHLEFPWDPDERLCPDLPRGRSKSIGGDLDTEDEGSKQNFEPL